MMGRAWLVLAVLCGCAQLGPVAGWEPRPAIASSLAGWNGAIEEGPGGWDARMGLVIPYESASLSIGPRVDAVWVKYFKAESFSLEAGVGAYLMHDGYWEEKGGGTDPPENGWIYVVPITCVGKYFFELIYRSGLKIYVGAGLGFYWAGTLNEPSVEINNLAFSVPLCFGVQLSPEERSTIEIEFKLK